MVTAADVVKLIVSTLVKAGVYVPAEFKITFKVSVPPPPSMVSKDDNVCVEFAFRPALIVSFPVPPVTLSIAAVNVKV
jgi:hypothetical protein